jgi:hypothetical protein
MEILFSHTLHIGCPAILVGNIFGVGLPQSGHGFFSSLNSDISYPPINTTSFFIVAQINTMNPLCFSSFDK